MKILTCLFAATPISHAAPEVIFDGKFPDRFSLHRLEKGYPVEE